MYERTYGAKYVKGTYLTSTQVAANVRADLKAVQAAGDLPAETKFSVRKGPGGGSVDVVIRGYADADVMEDEADPFMPAQRRRKMKEWAAELLSKVEAIRWAYNYDGSDIQSDYFDVHYYGTTRFETDWDRKFEASEKVRMAARKARKAAAAS